MENREDEVEKCWQEFWKDIVTGPDGLPDLEQIKKELYDFKQALDFVPEVYSYVTGGRISKILTHPSAVIAEADGHYQRLGQEEKDEFKEDLKNLIDQY